MSQEIKPNEKLGLKELVAMGVGGMVGGGIFSVLGLSVALAGHAAPIAFALGGIIALLTGFSYTKLGFSYHSDGGSFTYLERAFKHKNISGIGRWLLLTGYIGTLFRCIRRCHVQPGWAWTYRSSPPGILCPSHIPWH